MEKVYLVECYMGTTLTNEEEEEHFVSSIHKTGVGATKYVEKQIKNWRILEKVPEEIKTKIIKYRAPSKNYRITYNKKYLSYWLTEIKLED